MSPWNSDGSEAMLFVFGSGATRAVIVDGRTFAFKRIVPGVHVGGRWALTNPRLYYHVGSGWTPRLAATDVVTAADSVVKDFAPDGYVEAANASMFGGEGNQSHDDRIWALQLRHATRGWELVVWDRQTNTIRGHLSLPMQATIGGVVDDFTISPRGNFLITSSNAGWTHQGTAIPQGHNVWTLQGTYLRNVPGTPAAHLDYCLDASGNEVVAFIDSKYASNDKVGQTWRIDGSAGTTTVDQFQDGFTGWNFHISCQSTLRPGYMVISSFPSTTPQSYDRYPMWDHLWAVKLDGSGRVAVIANAHHDVGSNAFNEYARMPFAVANRDLSAVWFTAAWDSATATVHSYVARRKP